MLYGLALPLGGDRLAHLINWSLGLGTAWMLVYLGRRQGSVRAGLLAALLFYSTPLVGLLSWKASVELSWTFYQLLAVYAVIVGLEESATNPRKWWLMGICLGFALSTKYTAWPLAGVLAALIVWRLRAKGESFSSIAGQSVAPALFALGIVSIWPLRNLLFYGNPIFPFYQDSMAPLGPHADWKGLMLDAHSRNLTTAFGSWNGAWGFILHPWSELTLGRSDVDMMGPILILGLPLLVVTRFVTDSTRTIFLAALSLWAIWGLTTDMARFFLPVFALVMFLYAVSFEALLSKPAKTLAYALLSIVLLDNFLTTANWFRLYEAEGVVTGAESVPSYLGRVHPSYGQTHYAAAEFIRAKLPPESRVLVLGDGRGFGIGRDFVASSRFSENPLVGYLRESTTPEEVPKFNFEVQHLTVKASAMMRRDAENLQAPDGRRTRPVVVVQSSWEIIA
ncbi:MAG: glycosyltransferase family 39 protein [Elusimicrobiota bacterium]|nr:MAG: glycosyltransferase family 39 protein [Elusimicrobiota bacterium]